MSCTQYNTKLFVGVNFSPSVSPQDSFYLIASSGGAVYYIDTLDTEEKIIPFAGASFPSGTVDFTILDKGLKKTAERRVFINNRDCTAKVNVNYDVDTSPVCHEVTVRINITDPGGAPLKSSCSVSVTDDSKPAPYMSTGGIFASLLLDSNPDSGKLIQQDPDITDADRDLILMTNDNRQYKTEQFATSNTQFHGNHPTVKGKVINALTKKTRKNIPVTLFTADGKYFGNVLTDEAGSFSFACDDIPDSTLIYLQTTPKSGLIQNELLVDEERFPASTLSLRSPTAEKPDRKPEKINTTPQQQQKVDLEVELSEVQTIL